MRESENSIDLRLAKTESASYDGGSLKNQEIQETLIPICFFSKSVNISAYSFTHWKKKS